MGSYLRLFYSQHIVDISAEENMILGEGGVPAEGIDTRYHFYKTGETYILSSPQGTSAITDGELLQLGEGITALFVNSEDKAVSTIVTNDIAEFTVGRDANCDFLLPSRRDVPSDLTYVSRSHAKVCRTADGWQIVPNRADTKLYVNGKAVLSSAEVIVGDIIEIGKYSIVITDAKFIAYVKPYSQVDSSTGTANSINKKHRQTRDKNLNRTIDPPKINRGPHVRTVIPSCEIDLPVKESIGDKPEFNWVSTLLPPVAMLAVMLGIFFISRNSMSLMYTVPMYGVSMVVAAANHRSQKKKFYKRRDSVEKEYARQSEVALKKIAVVKDRQREILANEYPSLDDCFSIVQTQDSRLWRVRPDEEMFLSIRLGLGRVPTKIMLKGGNADEGTVNQFSSSNYITDAPVVCPIAKYMAVGIVGNWQAVTTEMKNIVIHAATNHSYDELKIVFFIPESGLGEWEWVRWLPHTWNKGRTKRYIATDFASAMRYAHEIEDVMSKRLSQKHRDGREDPHYLFIVTDDVMMHGTQLLNMLTSGKQELNASILLSAESRNQLPAGCKAIIEMTDEATGSWYPTDDESLRDNFSCDWISGQAYESFARYMASVRIFDGTGKRELPSGISFLEGYGVNTVEELAIQRRWSNSHPGRSLSVPVGVKSNGETFYFDIHEKKHGPHGMASGRAGSGKSEMVQSWILSLALNFRPDQVSFIIVDFKGDGLLAPFRELPHLAGSISNLDHNFERNVVALQQEMNRRMALFSKHNVSNIVGYTNKYEKGDADEAVPFLMVVVDEFAELKQSHPEFMAAIDRVYTLGRSLGIYIVILAQDAASVASDRIQANSRFRWCMQVATSDASRGMLETTDAYTMSYAPGRGFVKVGDFETYEQIQSYWSGAEYDPDSDTTTSREKALSFVYLDGGRDELLESVDSNDSPEGKEITKVVEYIRQFADKQKVPYASQIWQLPMPKTITLDDIISPVFDGTSWPETKTLELTVGTVDDPNRQMQYSLTFIMSKTGHISVQGSPESGKSMFLLSTAISLAERYDPKRVQLYLFDYDKWALNLVRNLPHVKGSTAAAENVEIERMVQDIRDELSERKSAFLEVGAISHEGYNAVADEIPAVFILVDNISAAWDSSQKIAEILEEIALKGAGYGIYLVVTAPGNLPFKIANAFRTKLSLYQNDKSEYASIVGRCDISPEDYPGRGLVKLDYPVEFQTSLPVQGETEQERNKALHDLVDTMKNAWSVLGNSSKKEDESNVGMISVDGEIVLGVDKKSRSPILLSQSEKYCLLVSASAPDNRITFSQLFLSQLSKVNTDYVVFDDKTDSGRQFAGTAKKYFSWNDTSADQYIAALAQELQERYDQYTSRQQNEFAPLWLVIQNFKEFFDAIADDSVVYLKDIVTMGKEIGVYLIVFGDKEGIYTLGHGGEILTHAILREHHAVLIGDSFESHQMFTANLTGKDSKRELDGNEGWYILNGKAYRINLMCNEVE